MDAKSGYSFQAGNFITLKENYKDAYRARMVEWRNAGTVERISSPTKIARARALGYKSKSGFIVLRVRVKRGDLHKEKIMGGRRPRRYGYNKLTHGKSERWIAEERAQKRYPNLVTLNSYYLAEDGKYKFYEVILVDPNNPTIKNDSKLSWTASDKHKGRVFRGLTAAGKKARGLSGKGSGSEKSRPSIRANGRLRRH